jgi:hypothetical protein
MLEMFIKVISTTANVTVKMRMICCNTVVSKWWKVNFIFHKAPQEKVERGHMETAEARKWTPYACAQKPFSVAVYNDMHLILCSYFFLTNKFM